MIALGCWTAGILFVASVTILPSATADNVDDIVENLSKAKEKGEVLSPTCETTTSNLEKRGALSYDKDTGSLKYDVSAEQAN
jgi:hypothetical protein